jgi:predicted N-formylglutamate amidohydrolase
MIAGEQAEAFDIIGGNADCGLLVLCDHATAIIPPEFADLGLSAEQRARHIAFDIGALPC